MSENKTTSASADTILYFCVLHAYLLCLSFEDFIMFVYVARHHILTLSLSLARFQALFQTGAGNKATRDGAWK